MNEKVMCFLCTVELGDFTVCVSLNRVEKLSPM